MPTVSKKSVTRDQFKVGDQFLIKVVDLPGEQTFDFRGWRY